MPQSDASLHAWASVGLAIAVGALATGLYVQKANSMGTEGPNLADLEVIEASIAYRKAEPQKQPQKQKRAPVEEQIEGVSHDENKVVDPLLKKDEPKKPDDPSWKKYQRRDTDDPDLEAGKPVDDPGVFDPNAPVGWAPETKGDPYFQQLVAELRENWEYPKLLGTQGVPVGCVHLEKDGRVTDTLFKVKSGNAELDDSVERALTLFEKKRKKDAAPVPKHLLKFTTRWLCFKFEV